MMWDSGRGMASMLERKGLGYHPKFSWAVLVLVVLIVLMAAVAMLCTIPTEDSGADFPSLHQTTDPLRGLGFSDVRDALKNVL